MQWSKLKAKLKDLIVPELRDRVDFHLTRFRSAYDQVGRGWITIDGDEILDCSYGRWHQAYVRTKKALFAEAGEIDAPGRLKLSNQAIQQVQAQQIFSEKDFAASLTRFLESSIKEALLSKNSLIRAFALIDRRVGRRRFEKLKVDDSEHPLIQVFYRLRMECFEETAVNKS